MLKEVAVGRTFLGRLEKGADLLASLTRLAVENNIAAGRVEALGAVEGATLAFYDQKEKRYGFLSFEGPLEIVSLLGNISQKEGKPFVHSHVTLSFEDGRCVGGHLWEGARIFACEALITEFTGGEFSRAPDEATGLWLWRG